MNSVFNSQFAVFRIAVTCCHVVCIHTEEGLETPVVDRPQTDSGTPGSPLSSYQCPHGNARQGPEARGRKDSRQDVWWNVWRLLLIVLEVCRTHFNSSAESPPLYRRFNIWCVKTSFALMMTFSRHVSIRTTKLWVNNCCWSQSTATSVWPAPVGLQI